MLTRYTNFGVTGQNLRILELTQICFKNKFLPDEIYMELLSKRILYKGKIIITKLVALLIIFV